jgi:hypothetical protein
VYRDKVRAITDKLTDRRCAGMEGTDRGHHWKPEVFHAQQ